MNKFNNNARITSTKYSDISTKCNYMAKAFEMVEKNTEK